MGLHRRDLDHLWDVEPQSQQALIYGLNHGEDHVYVGNVTLEARPGLPMVLLERFDSLTERVDCKGKDGHMSLTFKNEDAFKRSLKAWDFVNKSPDHRFLLIANHDGCAPEDERQAYMYIPT